MSVTVLLCGVTARAYVLCVRLRYNVWRYGSPLTPPGSTRLQHTTGRWHASALCSSEADSGPHSSKELAFFFEALGDHLLQDLRRSMPNDDMHSAIGGRAGPGTCRLRSAPSAIQTWTHGGYGSVLSFLGSGIALLRKRRYGSPSTPPKSHHGSPA